MLGYQPDRISLVLLREHESARDLLTYMMWSALIDELVAVTKASFLWFFLSMSEGFINIMLLGQTVRLTDILYSRGTSRAKLPLYVKLNNCLVKYIFNPPVCHESSCI